MATIFLSLTNFALFLIFMRANSQVLFPVNLTAIDTCLPNPPPLSALQIATPFATCSNDVLQAQKNPDQDKTTPQILQTYNYPFKTYNITTKDNYILTVYRITGSPNIQGDQTGTKQAVYIQHGLMAASDCWNFQPNSRNLPFKLADAGYEVWLGNARGTSYSLGHTTYNSNVDLAYWNFSWHEMGIYDLPAVTDTIIAESKNQKIFYIGHSMGTTQFFVSLSEIPEMNNKILAGFMLAPIAYIGHSSSPLRLTFPLLSNDTTYQVINKAMNGKVESGSQYRTQFNLSAGDACDVTATKCGVCDNGFYALFGYDAPQMNNSEISNVFAKIPNTISVKTAAHYAQIGTDCSFKKYDYGASQNPKYYNTTTPPNYDLSKITAPTYFYNGQHDNLGAPNDVNMTASKFAAGVLKAVTLVNSNFFQHGDFLTAKDADILLYNSVLSTMQTYK